MKYVVVYYFVLLINVNVTDHCHLMIHCDTLDVRNSLCSIAKLCYKSMLLSLRPMYPLEFKKLLNDTLEVSLALVVHL